MGLKFTVKNASEAFVYKDQVTDQGLYIEHDYTWRYTPSPNDWWSGEIMQPATVEFDFKDEKWVTYFQLRWAK